MRGTYYSYSPAAGVLAVVIGACLQVVGAGLVFVPAQTLLEKPAATTESPAVDAVVLEAAFLVLKVPVALILYFIGWWLLLFGVIRLAVQPMIAQNDLLLKLRR